MAKTHLSPPANKMAQLQARVRKAEQNRIAEGGKRIPGGMLSPDAAEALACLVTEGYAPSQTQVINAALIEAARRHTQFALSRPLDESATKAMQGVWGAKQSPKAKAE